MSDKPYLRLIEILDGLYNPDYIEKENDIDWADLEIKATESIIEELFHFQNDEQRTGFLNFFFRRIFNQGKDYNLGLLKRQYIPDNWTKSEYEYIKNCKLVLNGLITDVSEACLQYDGIDFTEIMENNIKTSTEERPDFVWYVKTKSTPETDISTRKQSLSIPQIALKYYYEGELITRDNGPEIAKKYGFTSKTSGEKLYQNFTFYSKTSNRTGDPGTKIKMKNIIGLVKSVIELLPENKKTKPTDEVKILEKRLLKEY
ncbi:hypothetical protein [Prolixibacter denitrificans]|uniref:Uncharacterized protein n=1 Tax=Prolixibacter denitrificans TaxID=1541063 RepID=A0A2P8CJV4_9BACT|nr:hypothetical protein [Prolixibacter denitrificans]PSK85250.1 hypothetical protein CLV93_101202 [Prolixibacter denitrificans]GET19872.1 hypothetical protein JCM18694_01180 [Prolixibacter denitrificans]